MEEIRFRVRQSEPDPRAERFQRWRERQRKTWRHVTVAGMLLSFAAGAVLGSAGSGSAAPAWKASEPAGYSATLPAVSQGDELLTPPSGPIAVCAEIPEKLVESVPWSAEAQTDIWNVAGQDPVLFSAILAIASVESGFNCEAIGDSGQSVGPYQIQYRWQVERLPKMGLTVDDLKDPVKGAVVVAAILEELQDVYGFNGLESHDLYMAYNMGPSAARNALRSGYWSSRYSRKLLPVLEEFLEEVTETSASAEGSR